MELTMKFKSIISIIPLVLLFSGKLLYSQTEPKPPLLPRGELAPVFEEYQQIAIENEDKILKTLPGDVKEDLLKVKKIDEDKYYDILSEAPHFFFDLENAFMFDPFEKKRMEQSQLVGHWEMHTKALGFLFQHSSQNEKPGIKTKLQTKLEQLFDLKEEERKLEVKMLEHQLQELKTYFEERKNNKTQIINRRMQELLGMGKYLDWD